MKQTYIILFVISLFAGCNSEMKNENIVGVWRNTDEKCVVQFNKDFTFTSSNLPLDIENKYYITFNKKQKNWNGFWSLEKNQVKLTINNSYYFLDVSMPLISGKTQLYVKLLEESGGKMLYLDK